MPWKNELKTYLRLSPWNKRCRRDVPSLLSLAEGFDKSLKPTPAACTAAGDGRLNDCLRASEAMRAEESDKRKSSHNASEEARPLRDTAPVIKQGCPAGAAAPAGRLLHRLPRWEDGAPRA